MPVSNVYTLLMTNPFFVTIFAFIFLKEKVGFRRWSAVILGFIGVVIVINPQNMQFGYLFILPIIAAIFLTIRDITTKGIATKSNSFEIIFVTSLLIYFVGAKLFPDQKTQSNLGELLRTIGFSYSPGLIRAFSFNQDLLVITFYGSGIWSLIAMIIAVRQALDYQSTWRAIGVVVIGFLVQAIVLIVLVRIFGPTPN